MSLPKFPSSPPPSTKDSLNMVISSIAMEEMGLSHIINAEGEKIQYILGTLEGNPCKRASVDEILAVNKSVKSLLDSISQNQMLLKSKMECAVDALDRLEYSCPETVVATFPGCVNKCYTHCQPFKWQKVDFCSKNAPRLLDDCERIRLKPNKCYSISFTIDLCAAMECNNMLSIALQTTCNKHQNKFIYHAPIICTELPFTASASGIFLETCDCSELIDLSLKLISPSSIRVIQSSIQIATLNTNEY